MARPKKGTTAEKKTSNSHITDLLIKATGNKRASLLTGDVFSDIDDYIHTGSYMLNGLITGDINKGLPNNTILGLAGEEATGKTFLSIKTLINAQKQGYIVALFDSETSSRKNQLIDMGIDPETFIYIPVDTLEGFRDQCLKLVKTYNEQKTDEKIIIVLDSLGAAPTQWELDNAEKGANKEDMGRRAKVVRSIFRVLRNVLSVKKTPMIVISHVYAETGLFPTKKVAGGGGLKYAADVIIMLAKQKEKTSDKVVTGIKVLAKAYKQRFCRQDMQVNMLIDFKRGLHPYYGLQDFGGNYLKQKDKKTFSLNGEEISLKELMSNKWETKFPGLFEKVEENVKEVFNFGNGDFVDEIEFEEDDETELDDDLA